jgi:hypothetical protein
MTNTNTVLNNSGCGSTNSSSTSTNLSGPDMTLRDLLPAIFSVPSAVDHGLVVQASVEQMVAIMAQSDILNAVGPDDDTFDDVLNALIDQQNNKEGEGEGEQNGEVEPDTNSPNSQ